ncbi:MAG TPA: hypothetical protein VI756_10550 [Blastocatellia bacterium]
MVSEVKPAQTPAMANQGTATRLINRLMPSPGDVVFLWGLLIVLRLRSGLLANGSIARHVMTGKLILSSLRIPHGDPFSYTGAGASWAPTTWLSDVIFASAYRLIGGSGLLLVTGVCFAVTLFLIFRFAVHRGANAVVALTFLILIAWVLDVYILAGPEVFSFPLGIGYLTILDGFQRHDNNRLKFLPVLMLIWANLAVGPIAGIVMIAVYLGGNLVQGALAKDQGSRSGFCDRARKLSTILPITLVAAALNPTGPKIFLSEVGLAGDNSWTNQFAGLLSPSFHDHFGIVVFFAVAIAAFALSRRRPGFFDVALLLAAIGLGLYSVRWLPLLVLLLTPTTIILLSNEIGPRGLRWPGWAHRFRHELAKLSENALGLERIRNTHMVACAVLVAWGAMAGYSARTGRLNFTDRDHERGSFPVDALEFALANSISGNVFNEDLWGGYILLNSYPRYKVFTDDRWSMYGDEIQEEYAKVAGAKLGFEGVLDANQVNWVLFKANTSLCRVLFLTGKWKLVYADGIADILVRDTPENQGLITQYYNVNFVPDGYMRVDEYKDDPTGMAIGHH